jgi:hypothetical protein
MRDLTAVKDALKNHQIELPSWAFGNSGPGSRCSASPACLAPRMRRPTTPPMFDTFQPGRSHCLSVHWKSG